MTVENPSPGPYDDCDMLCVLVKMCFLIGGVLQLLQLFGTTSGLKIIDRKGREGEKEGQLFIRKESKRERGRKTLE